jgi:hypothetical protein
VKLDERYNKEETLTVVNGVTITGKPTPKSEQGRGDLIVTTSDGRTINIEVKAEQYKLRLDPTADRQARETGNIAFETHDIISPKAYETLWTQGITKDKLLVHPLSSIKYATPTIPDWYSKPGGHLRTQADWLIHFFELSNIGVVLSLRRIREAFNSGKFDDTRWFASCTAIKGSKAVCRKMGDTNIGYYTVGKLLTVQGLLLAKQAFPLKP